MKSTLSRYKKPDPKKQYKQGDLLELIKDDDNAEMVVIFDSYSDKQTEFAGTVLYYKEGSDPDFLLRHVGEHENEFALDLFTPFLGSINLKS